jgi:hypothetical protein
LTLADLLDNLDWSKADAARITWQKRHPNSEMILMSDDDKATFVIEALQGLIEVVLPDDVQDRRQELLKRYKEDQIKHIARFMLEEAGVWEQIRDLMGDGMYAEEIIDQ